MNPRRQDIDEFASDWILRRERGLSPEETREFAAWKDSDPRHADAIERHERAWAVLDRARVAGRAPLMVQELARRAVNRQRRTAGAIVCATLMLAGTWAWTRAPRERAEGAPLAEAVMLRPERKVLSDGSVVELRPGAEIATDFTPSFRRVVLRRGEAIFYVAKNKAWPFVVSAGGVEVKAVGTAFDVQLGAHETDVLVTEGRVQVLRNSAPAREPADTVPVPAPETPAFVDAGNRLSVSAATASAAPAQLVAVPISSQEIADQLSWRALQLEFHDMPLGEAVALMNRHSNLQLVVDDAQLASIRVNGLFRTNDAETFVRLLEANFSVRAERSGHTIALRPTGR